MICRALSSGWDELLALEEGERLCSRGWDLSLLLFFPNFYRVGMANVGFQSIYRLANAVPGVACDRCFLPDPSLQPLLDRGEELVSMELKQTPREFQVLAFSVSFELDLLNVIRLLLWSKVPPLARERGDNEPLVIFGGIVPSANPEPFAPIADVVVVGEGEEALPSLLRVLLEEGETRSPRVFQRLAQVPGVYVPSFYEPRYDAFGRFVSVKVWADTPLPVVWSFWQDFSEEGNTVPLVTPESSFPGVYLVEVSRGCPHLCKFCLSSHVCRPLRVVSRERLLGYLDTPRSRLGFVGTSLSHHPHLVEAVEEAVNKGKSVTFSSLRVDSPLPLLRVVSRESGRVTFGVEAATEVLRERVGKPLPQDLIMERLLYCVENGAEVLKLYFMVGLPGEDEEDLEALVTFPKRVLHLCRRHGLSQPQIHMSLASFVPKPHTPFQWCAMETRDGLRDRMRRVEAGLRRVKGITVTWEGPKWSLLQGLISRGDRRVGEALVHAWTSFGGNWSRALKFCNVSFDYYLHREREEDEPFPWEVVDTGWRRELLWFRGVSSRK